MKPDLFPTVLLVLGITLSPIAIGADAADGSPYDANPGCMDRTTDSSAGACVPQVEGTPRHTYPPRAPAGPTNSGGAATGTSSGSSAAGTGARDGGRNRAGNSGGR